MDSFLYRAANQGRLAIAAMKPCSMELGWKGVKRRVSDIPHTRPSAHWNIAGTADFNGDGKGDLLWRDSGTGAVAIWLMNGVQIAKSGNLGVVSTNWGVAGTGDFNGDGKSDVLWRNISTGATAIWLINGLQILQTGTIEGVVQDSWGVVGTGDFNGDGNADILWRDASGNVAQWLMNGTGILQSTTIGCKNAPKNDPWITRFNPLIFLHFHSLTRGSRRRR